MSAYCVTANLLMLLDRQPVESKGACAERL